MRLPHSTREGGGVWQHLPPRLFKCRWVYTDKETIDGCQVP